jgi:hypothetical protein
VQHSGLRRMLLQSNNLGFLMSLQRDWDIPHILRFLY